jgi:3-deoxy-D-manno-octulosonate 8-phosphate phosphatase (KDO 8-P phosphatase)
MAARGWSLEQACFMGDDINDLEVLQQAGVSACPADAVDAVRRQVGWVSRWPGGKGAARELIDWVLATQARV